MYIYIIYKYIYIYYIYSIFYEKIVVQTCALWNPKRLFSCLTKPNSREETLLTVISRRIARCTFSRCDWNYLKENQSETSTFSLEIKLREKQRLERNINLLPLATISGFFL